MGRPLTSTTTFQTYKQKKKVKKPNQTKAPLTPFVEYIRIQYKSPFISSFFFCFLYINKYIKGGGGGGGASSIHIHKQEQKGLYESHPPAKFSYSQQQQ